MIRRVRGALLDIILFQKMAAADISEAYGDIKIDARQPDERMSMRASRRQGKMGA